MKVGDRFETNSYGWVTVVESNGWDNVTIKFDNTGTQSVAISGNIRSGSVKDVFVPSVHGVGFFGIGKHKAKIKGKDTKPYKTWAGMMERCYGVNASKDNPSYVDCVVCDEWHNFQVFAEWFKVDYKSGLHIDKDILGDGKLYSPDTCKFITQAENTEKAHAKHYSVVSPDGIKIDVYNMAQFCRDNGLGKARMSAVILGERNHHKGWRKA